MATIVRRDRSVPYQRHYVHEVYIKKNQQNLQDPGDAKAKYPGKSADIISLLELITDVNEGKLTKHEILNRVKAQNGRYSLPKLDARYEEAYSDDDEDAMREILDEAAARNGYNFRGYHHTENYFTEFDLGKARRNMDIQGFS